MAELNTRKLERIMKKLGGDEAVVENNLESTFLDKIDKLADNANGSGSTSTESFIDDTKGANVTVLPENLTSIRAYAFYNCTQLNITKIPKATITIGSYAFYGCSGLRELTIEGDITSIGTQCFRNCSNLAKIVMPNVTSVPTLNSTNSIADTAIDKGVGYIYVPDDLLSGFQSATNWSTYSNRIKALSALES